MVVVWISFYTVSRGDFVAQEQEVDVRAQNILTGLGELRALLEEPITRHALDLTNNAKTASQHDILNRTHRSLTQYLKLEGDLFYVGLLGHFSTGKSSTINSVLGAWNTVDERPTDQNPTDNTISLITRPANEKYLLGVIREGTVTIRSKPIDNRHRYASGSFSEKKHLMRRRLPVRFRICFCASFSTEIAIMKEESLKFSVAVSHGPENPSTYVTSEKVRTLNASA
jgi:hypothetical protein